MKTQISTRLAKLKTIQDEKEAAARNVKVKQEADDTSNIYN